MASISTDSVLANIGITQEIIQSVLKNYFVGLPAGSVVVGRFNALDLEDPAYSHLVRVPSVAEAVVAPGTKFVIIEDFPGENEWSHQKLLHKQGAAYLLDEVRSQLIIAGASVHLKNFMPLPDLLVSYEAALGKSPYGFDAPIVALNTIYPLKGKKVLEFGPLDGTQTAAILKAEPATLDAVEIRPDNFAKVAVAKEVYGWHNLRLIFDNFHAVDATRYGRYDAVVAHGVYYHSNSPFVFLENLVSLSDVILMGGYCGTDDSPQWDWLTLEHGGKQFRAKPYQEADHFTAGVSAGGYYFAKDALVGFFEDRGYQIHDLEVTTSVVAGRGGQYVRFVARR